jgi:hypothetical protein
MDGDRKIVLSEEQAQELVDITVVLDASGSMASRQKETMDGFNKFVEEQGPKSAITLVLFSYKPHEVFSAMAAENVPKLNAKSYVPSGGTALFDAVGHGIVLARSRYEGNLPSRRVLLVITDGEENASREHTSASVKKLMEDCKAEGWLLIFIGASDTDWKRGGNIGAAIQDSASFDSQSPSGVYAAYAASAVATSAYVKGQSMPISAAIATEEAADLTEKWKKGA